MKDICDLKEQELISTHNNFIRHSTLIEGSDAIINKVVKLPIFEKYTLTD